MVEKEPDQGLHQAQVRLWQYRNLRAHFNEMVKEVLGEGYHNEGMDVYTCDEYTCRDLILKFREMKSDRR